MQFGIFTVGDLTEDPTTGRTPTEHERIKNTVAIAAKAEEVGLDVFATGGHHNPPFVLEQLDILGEQVVPVLRREFAALKPAHVPEALTHESLLAAARQEVAA